MEDEDGSMTIGLLNISQTRVNHFNMIFVEDERVSVAQMIRLIGHYPTYVNGQKKIEIVEEITLGMLEETIQSLQKDKSLGPDGWPVEFFEGFLDFFLNDLIKAIK